MFKCERCSKVFEKRPRLLRHVSTVHAEKRERKRGAPESAGAAERNSAEGGSNKKQKLTQQPLGDRWPEQQLVVVTGTAGDVLPWSSRQDMMFLAPVVVCGVAIPRGWNSRSACGLLGLDPDCLRETR